MVGLRYDETLLRQLPPGQGVWVRGLCERSHPYSADYAETLQRWFHELRGNKGMRRRLTSPIDTEFQAGRWELTAGRLFHNLGFRVEFDPPVTTAAGAPKTPDFRATRGELKPLVEVFNLNSSAAEAEEDERRRRLAEELTIRLSIESGYLSLVLYPGHDLDSYPDSTAIDSLSAAIQQWWDSGRDSGRTYHVRLPSEQIAVHGHWMPSAEPFFAAIAPAARALHSDRISNRLAGKLGSYKNLDGEQIVLFVGSDYWTHSATKMVEAMFGGTEISLSIGADGTRTGAVAQFSGKGLLTEDAIFGHPASRLIAGCMYASHAWFNAANKSWNLNVWYAHNPYADVRLPDGLFDPIPEMQVGPGGMAWTTEAAVSVPMP